MGVQATPGNGGIVPHFGGFVKFESLRLISVGQCAKIKGIIAWINGDPQLFQAAM
jgi:hypothetical protein